MEKIVNLPRHLRAHAFHFRQVGRRGALDRLERAEVLEQRAPSRTTRSGQGEAVVALLLSSSSSAGSRPSPARGEGDGARGAPELPFAVPANVPSAPATAAPAMSAGTCMLPLSRINRLK